MSGIPVHVIDFEGSRASGIVEYGVVTVAAGEPAAFHTRLCAATGPIAARDRATHGIDAAQVAGLAPFADDWPLFSRLRSSGPLCAHSAAVEDGLLRNQWPLAGSVPDFARGGGSTTWGPWIDTLELARRFLPGLASYRLDHLIDALGLADRLTTLAAQACPASRRRYHCALYDAIAAALVFVAVAGDAAVDETSLRRWVIESAASADRRSALDQRELFD